MDKTIFMELLHAREFKAVRSILNVMNTMDIALCIEPNWKIKNSPRHFADSQIGRQADVFQEMNSSMQSYPCKNIYGRRIERSVK